MIHPDTPERASAQEPTAEQLRADLNAARDELDAVYGGIFDLAAKLAKSAVTGSEQVMAMTDRHPALASSNEAVSARTRAACEEKVAQEIAALLPTSFFEVEAGDFTDDGVE